MASQFSEVAECRPLLPPVAPPLVKNMQETATLVGRRDVEAADDDDDE